MSRWVHIAVSSLASLFILPLPVALADAVSAKSVTLNGTTMPEVVGLVAVFGSPTTTATEADNAVSLNEIVEEKCGSIDPVYLQYLYSRNPQLQATKSSAKLKAQTKVSLPACARFPAVHRVVMKEHSQASDFIDKEVTPVIDWPSNRPAVPSFTFAEVKDFVPFKTCSDTQVAQLTSDQLRTVRSAHQAVATFLFWRFNGIQAQSDFTKLQSGTTLAMPLSRPVPSTIPLADGCTRQDVERLWELAMQVHSSGDARNTATLQDARQAELIEPLAIDANRSGCPTSPGHDNWPIDVFQLLRAAYWTQDYDTRVGATSAEATVLVVDTGFDFIGDQRIAAEDRYRSIKWDPLIIDLQGSTRTTLLSGVNLATGRPDFRSWDDKDFKFRWHGNQVTTLVLGGPMIGALPRLKLNKASVSIANAFDNSSAPPVVWESAFDRALRVAVINRIPIVNFSIGTKKNDPAILAAFSNPDYKDVLVVAAAGNNPTDDQPNVMFPAAFGGAPSPRDGATVISVGAHGPDGHVLPQTLSDGNDVDFLAPGCDIPAYIGNVRKDENGDPVIDPQLELGTGTSFAAPIASFVAAYLASEGLSPNDIKARLIVSTDVDDALADAAFSRGRLNPAKAIVDWTDVLEVRQGRGTRLIYGKVTSKGEPLIPCDNQHTVKLLDLDKLAITRDSDGKPLKVHIWERKQQEPDHLVRLKRRDVCTPFAADMSTQTVTIRNIETGLEESYSLNDLMDYVQADRN